MASHVSKRRSSTNYDQKSALLAYMKDNKCMLTKKFSSTFSFKDYQQKWEELRDMINALGPAKTVKEWQKYWNDQCSRSKRKAVEQRNSQVKNGGGSPQHIDINEFEESIIELYGGRTWVHGHHFIPEMGIPGSSNKPTSQENEVTNNITAAATNVTPINEHYEAINNVAAATNIIPINEHCNEEYIIVEEDDTNEDLQGESITPCIARNLFDAERRETTILSADTSLPNKSSPQHRSLAHPSPYQKNVYNREMTNQSPFKPEGSSRLRNMQNKHMEMQKKKLILYERKVKALERIATSLENYFK